MSIAHAHEQQQHGNRKDEKEDLLVSLSLSHTHTTCVKGNINVSSKISKLLNKYIMCEHLL